MYYLCFLERVIWNLGYCFTLKLFLTVMQYAHSISRAVGPTRLMVKILKCAKVYCCDVPRQWKFEIYIKILVIYGKEQVCLKWFSTTKLLPRTPIPSLAFTLSKFYRALVHCFLKAILLSLSRQIAAVQCTPNGVPIN